MGKTVFRSVLLVALSFCICFGYGCSKSADKAMKVPEIKMITPENVHGVIAPDDNNIWVVGNYGVIHHSSDGGETWTKQESGVHTLLVDGCFINNTTGWVTGLYGVILHTSDGGKTWTKQKTGTGKHLFSVSFVDENYGWAVGEWHTIINTTDGGKTWNHQVQEQDKILSNVLFLNRNLGWLVGEAGTIMKTTDGGRTWTAQVPKAFERESFEAMFEDPPPALFGISFTDENTGWLCGIDATIMHTNDGGATWNQIPLGIENALFSIIIKGDIGWTVGDKGACLLSLDGGKTWTLQEDVIKSKMWFRDVTFSSADNGWVVGSTGTVVGTTDSGKTWEFRSGLSYAMEFFQMPKALEFKGMVTE